NPSLDDRGRIAESGRHYADHGVGLGIQSNGAREHSAGSIEPALPQTVTDDDGARRAWTVLLGTKDSSQGRRNAERVEQIRRARTGVNPLRGGGFRAAGHIEAGVTDARDLLERS